MGEGNWGGGGNKNSDRGAPQQSELIQINNREKAPRVLKKQRIIIIKNNIQNKNRKKNSSR